MKEDKVKKLAVDLIKDVSDKAKKVGPHFEKERIHEFRVAFKSLRAMTRLLDSCSDQLNFKLNTALKDIYHISGAIRDAQLELEKIKHIDILLPGCPEHLGYIISDYKEKWEEGFSKKIMSKTESAIAGLDTAICTRTLVEHFIKVKLDSVSQISQYNTITDDELHIIRKQMKDIFYILKIIPDHLKPDFNNTKLPEPDELKVITDGIGTYNDDRIFMEHIRAYSEKSGEQVLMKLKRFMADMAAQLKARKEQICDDVNKIIMLK